MFHFASFTRRATVAIACSALLAGSANAATQGTLGATSTGSINITATVAARAQITGLTDVTFTAVDPTVSQTSAQSDCVWTNTLNGGYTITATGSGTNGAFTLTNSSNTAAYTVQWAGTASQSSGTALTAKTASSGFTSTATSPTCAAAPLTTSSLIIGIPTANLMGMTANTNYTGTLTLLVTPM